MNGPHPQLELFPWEMMLASDKKTNQETIKQLRQHEKKKKNKPKPQKSEKSKSLPYVKRGPKTVK